MNKKSRMPRTMIVLGMGMAAAVLLTPRPSQSQEAQAGEEASEAQETDDVQEPPEAEDVLEAPPAEGVPESPDDSSSQDPVAMGSSTSTDEYYHRALRMYRHRDFRGALAELNQVSDLEPDRAEVLYLIGYCHYILKQFDESLEAFHRTFRENPEFDPRTIY